VCAKQFVDLSSSHQRLDTDSLMNSTIELWSRLLRVKTFYFELDSRVEVEDMGWKGTGSGLVEFSQPNDDVLDWKQHGCWRQNGGCEVQFFNPFRWTKFKESIGLAQTQFAQELPVFSFEVAYITSGKWCNVKPHYLRQGELLLFSGSGWVSL